MEACRIRLDRGMRRLAPALLLVLLVTLALPARSTAATARVTVTITGVFNISEGDVFGGAPDFFTRINIGNGTWFQGPIVFNNHTPSTAGWSHTASVSTAASGGRTPIRIELLDFDSPLDPDLVDIDPSVCPPAPFGVSGCQTLSSNRPPPDNRGLDLTLGVNPLPGTSATFTGVESGTGGDAAGTAGGAPTCVSGSESHAAMICFTITVTRTPETLRVTKLADTDDGRCLPIDCSLRDAVTTAGPGDTILLPDLGGRYRLTFRNLDTRNEPGHLKITQPGLIIRRPMRGGPADELGPPPPNPAIIEQTLSHTRVFDIHVNGGLELRDVTLTGGGAGPTSTAVPSHVHGGAIHNHGTLKLVNVTITGNRATDSGDPSVGGGGGIYNAGTAALTNVTIAGNDASVRAGGLAGNPMTLHNVLIAGNTGGNGNCDVAQIDDGGNLQFPAGACGVPVATRNPIGSLTDGVFRLPPGSEAIDQGSGTSPPDCPAFDQIATPRPLDGDGDGVAACDTGATEYAPTGKDVVHRPRTAFGRPGPVTLTFDDVVSAGTSSLRIVKADPAAPKGFRAGKPARYYDLTTTATYTGSVRVCVRHAGQSFGGAGALRLFQRTKETWTDTTVSRAARAGRVCGRSASLGRFAVFASHTKGPR